MNRFSVDGTLVADCAPEASEREPMTAASRRGVISNTNAGRFIFPPQLTLATQVRNGRKRSPTHCEARAAPAARTPRTKSELSRYPHAHGAFIATGVGEA